MAEAPTGAAASLDGVRVHYSGRPPLGPLDLTIAPGEIVAIVGASGAGKSTALRLLAGLEPPSTGTVQLTNGRTGLVFQSATLMPWADALANVALPLELAGMARAEARDRAAGALTAVALGDRLNARPRQLSGGMAMRVALARALVTEPDLLLLDEPFAALDSVNRRRLIEDLHRLWVARTPRPAIVFVTHDVEEAVYLADRVVVLDAATGRLEWKMPCCGDMSFLYSPAIGSPAVGGGRVHVPANGNKLYAFDLATGAEAWVFSSPGEKVGYSSPRLAGGALYIGCLGDNGQVRRIDAATGREVWMAETGSTIYDSSPVLIDGWAAIVSVDGTVSLIDQATGRVAAQHRLLPGLGLSTPAARDGRLFAASNSGAVVGFALTR